MHSVKKPETPAQVYRRIFPRAFVGMVYADRMNRYVEDVGVWEQVLQDERYRCSIEKKGVRMIPWLIESYQKAMKSWREIETPADRLTDYAGDRGQPVDFKAALAPLTDEKRAEMLAIYEEERQKVLKQRGLA